MKRIYWIGLYTVLAFASCTVNNDIMIDPSAMEIGDDDLVIGGDDLLPEDDLEMEEENDMDVDEIDLEAEIDLENLE